MKRNKVVGLAAAVIACVTMASCSSGGSSTSSGSAGGGKTQTASILMNWFAQAEQGGYWEAMSKQYAANKGVTIDVKQGGPSIATIPQVASGQANFGVGNADELLVARKNGLPIVALAAAYNTNLQCMMFHKGTGITSFPDLNGHQVARAPLTYWDYLAKHFNLTNVQAISDNGSLADFKRNQNLVQQCYVTSEPYVAKQQGIDFGLLSVAKDGGYNPYGVLLFTTESVVKQNPDMVRAVTAATVQGWTDFLADPSAAKKAVIAANNQTDPAAFDYAAQTIKSGGYVGSPVGGMTDARWKMLRDQLASIGLIPADLDYTKAFTTAFLPK